MNAKEQLHSFTGTLTYNGTPVTLNYNRLTRLILDKNTSNKDREYYQAELQKRPEHVTTAEQQEPELLYFQRVGDQYLISTRGPGRYTGQTLSMEGQKRTWSAYSGSEPTAYVISRAGFSRLNLSVEDLIADQLDIDIFAGGHRTVVNYGIPGAPAAFTDTRGHEDDYEDYSFKLTIIERNVGQ